MERLHRTFHGLPPSRWTTNPADPSLRKYERVLPWTKEFKSGIDGTKDGNSNSVQSRPWCEDNSIDDTASIDLFQTCLRSTAAFESIQIQG